MKNYNSKEHYGSNTATTTELDVTNPPAAPGSGDAASAHAVGQNFLAVYLSNLTWLEVLSVLISLALLAAVVYFAIETGWFANRVDRFRHVILQSNISKYHAQESWHHIQEHLL